MVVPRRALEPEADENATAQPTPGPHTGLALTALCLSVVLVSMDNMIVNVALPTMSRDLEASTRDLQWIVDGYTTAFAALLLVGGYLGDRFGHYRLLTLGLAGFMVSSWAATQLDSVPSLVAARVAMGACAAMLYPCTLALLTSIFSGPRLPMAIGMWSGVSGAGVAMGPILGGVLLKWFHWSAIFWINIPVVATGLLLGAFVLKGHDHERRIGGLDVAGATLSATTIGVLVYGIIEAPAQGWHSHKTMATLAMTTVLLVAFIAVEMRVDRPLLDLRLLKRPAVSAAAGCISIAHFALFGFIFAITMYFQLVKGWGTLQAGMATLPYATVMAALSPVAMLVAKRLGSSVVIAGGMLLMGAGLSIATLAEIASGYWPVVVCSMMIMAAGMGLSVGPATSLLMDAVPQGFAGVGSGINDTTREVGGALGVAVLGSVLNTMFHSGINDGLSTLHVPQSAISAARVSLGNALSVAQQLPAPLAGRARETALHAFTHAMHGATWVAIAATCVSALLAAVALPRSRKDSSQ